MFATISSVASMILLQFLGFMLGLHSQMHIQKNAVYNHEEIKMVKITYFAQVPPNHHIYIYCISIAKFQPGTLRV